MLDALDRYSLAAKRPVTLPLVREALERKHVKPWLGRHKVNPHLGVVHHCLDKRHAGE